MEMAEKLRQLREKSPAVNRNISLTIRLDQALREQAEREDRTMSKIVRRALMHYLGHQYLVDEAREAA